MIVQELLDSPSVSQSSKDVIIEDAGIDRSPMTNPLSAKLPLKLVSK